MQTDKEILAQLFRVYLSAFYIKTIFVVSAEKLEQ